MTNFDKHNSNEGDSHVSSHAKASSAGSTQRRGSGLGRIFRGAFATSARFGATAGRGAPSATALHPVFGLVSLAVTMLMFLGFVGSASAATTHNPEPFSPLTGSGSGLTLQEGSAVAVDEETGNVFVSDGGPGHERVAILGGEGGAPVGLAAPYEIPGFEFGQNSLAYGIAFDNSATSSARGTLYVDDPATGGIKKYTRNPTSERYESVGELTIPNPARAVQLNVDGSGNLWADSERTVYELTPTGTILHEYDLVFPEGNEIPQGAVPDAAGDLFVVTTGGVYKFAANGAGEVDPTPTKLDSGFGSGIAYDPAVDRVFAGLSREIGEYDAGSGNKIDGFGAEVIDSAHGVTVDSADARIYASERESGHRGVDVFGPGVTVPTVGIGPASGVTGTKATLSGSVDPEGLKVTECFFEWGKDVNGKASYEHNATCEGNIGEDSSVYQVTAPIAGLTPNGVTYHFRLVARNGNGFERSADQTLQTLDTVTTDPASGLGKESALLNGTVRPEGLPYTTCVFEYGLTSSAGFEKAVPCNPPANAIGADFEAHPVSAALKGLNTNATYKFRLSATNSAGKLTGSTLTFSTVGPPIVMEIRSSNADQSSATLEAAVDPRGFGTTYRFEFGLTSAYGHRVPAEFDLFAGSGEEPLQVSARISGLVPATTYHYRVVATSSAGTTASSDQLVETLNACGFPEGRCLELVSPPEVGPVDLPGEYAGQIELHYQVGNRPGALAYVSESGTPDATKGAEVLSRAVRGPSEWATDQLSPAITALNESASGSSASSKYFTLNEELNCGIVASNQPLTPDAATNQVLEEGGSNLYRQNADPSSFTAITSLAPLNPTAGEAVGNDFAVENTSADCGKVVFRTIYNYPGVASNQEQGGGGYNLYEWDEGTLRSVAYVPGSGGEEVLVPTLALATSTDGYTANNGVSADGSRVFFRAQRKTAPNQAEVGTAALFVREVRADGVRTTRTLSTSETSTGDTGAIFQFATADGERAFFLANAGLTAESSGEGQDLYEYNFATERLTDLSPEQESGGAEVAGFIGASTDGSHVYFAARGQLVPGEGKTFAENVSAGTYSIFSEENGNIAYAGSFTERRVGEVVLTNSQRSQVTPDGRYLLFESSANVTGYRNDNDVPEAYIYDSAAAADGLACVSCRQDGKQSVSPRGNHRVGSAAVPANALHAPRALAERNGLPIVFFSSFDVLAPGAEERVGNIYEWAHGQVFKVTTEPPGQNPPENSQEALAELTRFIGTNEDGTDLYFVTTRSLNWEDKDQRVSVYDARIGGGHPEPPSTAAPQCKPAEEGSCRGSGGSLIPLAPPPASQSVNGPGNPKPVKKHHKKKHHKKKHLKKKHHKKKQRHANRDRRTGK